MLQIKSSPRPKIHPYSITTIMNSPNPSEYFLEANQFNNIDTKKGFIFMLFIFTECY